MLPVKGSPTTRTETARVLANDCTLERGPTACEGVPGKVDHTGIREEPATVAHGGKPCGGGSKGSR